MVDPEKASDLLSDVKANSHFKLHMGTNIVNLMQLSEALDIIADGSFKHHVTAKKNDFAAWVRHAVGDEELAKSIEKIKDRRRIADKLRRRISYLESRKSQNMISTKEFLTCGATDFVLGAIIGFVIGMIIAVVV